MTVRGLVIFTIVTLLMVLGLYANDQRGAQILTWDDYQEIFLALGVLYIILPMLDFSFSIGGHFGLKKTIIGFVASLFLSTIVGLYGLLASFALVILLSRIPVSEMEILQPVISLSHPSPTILIMLGISIAFSGFLTMIAYFGEGRD